MPQSPSPSLEQVRVTLTRALFIAEHGSEWAADLRAAISAVEALGQAEPVDADASIKASHLINELEYAVLSRSQGLPGSAEKLSKAKQEIRAALQQQEAGSLSDEEIATWADNFIQAKAFNRPIAVQIATEAAKWVRGQRVQVGWYYESPATGGTGLRQRMTETELAEWRRLAHVWPVYRTEREAVPGNAGVKAVAPRDCPCGVDCFRPDCTDTRCGIWADREKRAAGVDVPRGGNDGR